jgi:lipopolysaccharide transport system ATP-binding protein
MPRNVIEINNLGKQYRLGQVGASSIADDFKRWTHRLRGKEDPFLRIGDENDRTKKGDSNYVWALQNINFSVQQGEVLGIIGKNGAGKSTLLKILSRTTTPTVGEYRIKGRIASLLEVGTGFHPDLTGRENVFLNGAILGMTKHEIKKQLDAIIDFSGVERYIDTPVKRYSSGMYVRLAFAVAAHLNSDILIVDEVLAVGDAEFQKKCLGKMKDVSKEGITVLFVSHILPAVKNLCTKCLYLEKGKINSIGETNDIIKKYLRNDSANTNLHWESKNDTVNITQSAEYKINTIRVVNSKSEETPNLNIGEKFYIEISFSTIKENAFVGFSIVFSDTDGNCLFGSLNNRDANFYSKKLPTGNYKTTIEVPENLFNNIDISVNLICFSAQWTSSFVIENVLKFNMFDDGILKADYYGNFGGFFRPKLEWNTTLI